MADQIILEPEVAEQLEQLRIEGLYKMFDYSAIQNRALNCDFFAAEQWMANNKDKWGALVMGGFSVNIGDEVLTSKEFFERFPVSNLGY